jgi:DNA-binding MarR family transcriptional regulator
MTSTGEAILARLEAFDLKQEGQGKYRCNSPLRPGSNSRAFSLRIEADGEHGAFQDFAGSDSDKGSLYELAKRLGIDLPQRSEVADTKRAYADLVDYAHAHGVGPEVFHAAKWRQVVYQQRPALEFPTQTGTRWRFIDGKKPVYKSVEGYKRCWYGAQRAIGMEIFKKILILCNGEASTIVGLHHGLPAMCVTGGEAQLPNELIKELEARLWGVPAELELIIALDCDRKGREAALKIEAQFKAFGFTNARAVDLQLGDKGDLADFCRLHGGKALEALQALPALAHLELEDDEDEDGFQIYDIMEFDKLPPMRWIIPGEIPEQGFVMLFGESNVGKSFIAVDYALRIAEEHQVIYVACEGESGVPLRVDGWLHHHHKQRDQFKFKLMVGFVSFFERENVSRFIEFIKPHNPYVIVVDTLGLVMGSGDENSARDVVAVIRGCRRMQKHFGCTLIFVHHTNKGGIQERGSGQLRGRMDTIIQVLPDDDLIRIESSKTRDLEKFEPKSIKLLPVEVPGKGQTLVPVPAEQVIKNNDVTPDQRKLLEVLGLSVYAKGISQRDLCEMSRMTYRQTVNALSNLVDKGYVSKPRSTRDYHSITNDGRAAIGLPLVSENQLDQDDGLDQQLDQQPKSDSSLKKGIGSLDPLDHVILQSPAPDPKNIADPMDPIDPIGFHGKPLDQPDPINQPLFDLTLRPTNQYDRGV